MSEEDQDFGAAVEMAWTAYRGGLAARLAMMEQDDMFALDVQVGVAEADLAGAAPYVQFVAWSDEMIRAEAVGNHYLDGRYRLTVEREDQLVALGWQTPTHAPEEEADQGSANFWLDVPVAEADRLAELAVRTVREVYGCAHPAFLEPEDDEIPPPGHEPGDRELPGLAEADDPEPTCPGSAEELTELVDRTVASMFDQPLRHDPDGDIPIVVGSSVLFVRIVEDRPAVDLFAELVLGVRDRARVAQELDLLNRSHQIARFRLRDDAVVMEHRLLAWPFAASQLRLAIGLMLEGLDASAEALATRLGGHRFAETPTPASRLPADLSVDVDDDHPGMVALLELLHVELPTPRMVAALFGGDVELLAGQISRVRCGAQLLDGHDQDTVVTVLRRALRVAVAELADVRDSSKSRGVRTRRVGRQLSLLPEADEGFDSLDAAAWTDKLL